MSLDVAMQEQILAHHVSCRGVELSQFHLLSRLYLINEGGGGWLKKGYDSLKY